MDQAEEWRRLKEFYAGMNDGELEVVASEAYDLTDAAKLHPLRQTQKGSP